MFLLGRGSLILLGWCLLLISLVAPLLMLHFLPTDDNHKFELSFLISHPQTAQHTRTRVDDVDDDCNIKLYKPTCEKSGQCLVVDIADAANNSEYPGLLNAKVDRNKVKSLNVTALRGKHLRIRTIDMFLSGCGFFTFPLIVMNQLRTALKYGLVDDHRPPVVYLPEEHHYYDGCPGETDFWEEWFLPIVPGVRWKDVGEEDVWEFSQASIRTMYYDSKNIKAYPYGGLFDSGSLELFALQRSRAHSLVKEYIRVRPELVEQSKHLFEKLTDGKPTIGVHMRGTDKSVTAKVNLSEYYYHIDQFLSRHPNGAIFLATDDPNYLKDAMRKYGARVRFLNATRETNNVLYNDSVNKKSKSREVLFDMLLLSFSTTLVKPFSGVSEFSVYFRQAGGEDFESIVDLQMFSRGFSRNPKQQMRYNTLYKSGRDDVETTRASYLPVELDKGDGALSEEEYSRLISSLDAATSKGCQGPTFQPYFHEWGFGAMLNSLVKPVFHALNHGYCLQEPLGWRKFNCSGWEALFRPFADPLSEAPLLSNMTQSAVDTTHCAKIFATDPSYDAKGVPLYFLSDEYHECCLRYSYDKHGSAMLPARHKSVGFFASVSIVLNYLYHPSSYMVDLIEREKQDMDWPPPGTPILGIHYRAGDACHENTGLGRTCTGFNGYMKMASLMREIYGINHIYLATDSDEVIKILNRYPKWQFHYRKSDERGGLRDYIDIDLLLGVGIIDGCTEGVEAFLDVHILGDCDAFLGKFSSNIARLAYNFMYARARRHRPHVSLDNIWCFDFGVESRPNGDTWEWNQTYYC